MRQFPHNMCRFNVSERELDAIVQPWAREQWVEFGERRWNVNQARLTILEGPRIPPEQLSMGRGWRAAQRLSKDVTESVLAAARAGPSHCIQFASTRLNGKHHLPEVTGGTGRFC